MGWFETHGHSVKKPAATVCALDPEPVHRWDQPDDPRDPSERHLRRRLVVDPHMPGLTGFGLCLDFVDLGAGLDLSPNFPTQCLGSPDQFLCSGAPQATARGKKRNGLEDIGLACSVRAVDRNRARIG